jgi:2-amino-4-hydroxy-6-hydroxymethyldihydropteridine diphosphokinase
MSIERLPIRIFCTEQDPLRRAHSDSERESWLFSRGNVAWLGMGGNIVGTWGNPVESFRHAITTMQNSGLRIIAISPVVNSPPLGQVRQPSYRNSVLAVSGSISTAALLRLVKRLEREAGRRPGARWGARPLDIDILSHGGRLIRGHARSSRQGSLVVPHPEAHRRGFVLVPLARLAPLWRHPRLGVTARTLLARQPSLWRGIRIEAAPLLPIKEDRRCN